jgi:hypothetical protein
LTSFDQQAAGFETTAANQPPGTSTNNLVRLNAQAASLLDILEGADMPPTAQAVAAARELATSAAPMLAAWRRFKTTDLDAINAKLKAAGLTPLEIAR